MNGTIKFVFILSCTAVCSRFTQAILLIQQHFSGSISFKIVFRSRDSVLTILTIVSIMKTNNR